MIRELTQSMMRWLKRVVTEPRDELDRWQRAARFAYDLGRYGAKQLARDRASQMAAALAFDTLFALVPVLVVTTIMVKAIRGTDAFVEISHDLVTAMGLADIRILAPSEIAAEPAAASMTLAQWLEKLINQAASINLAAVGWIGLAMIIYAAIGLVVTIENSFNMVYRAPEGRPWTRRIPLYWFILTVSPVAIGITWYLNATFTEWVASVTTGQWLLAASGIAWNLLVGWLLMLTVYTTIPNTNVALRPAMAGAFVSAALLEIGKRSLGAYLDNAFSISQLYGSLGLIPLFMFWVYLMWLAVLFGLEVSATLQMLHGRDLDTIRPQPAATGLFDPTSVVTVMEMVAERFAAGHATTARHVAEVASLPEMAVVKMFEHLERAGILHRIEAADGAVTLARPVEHVTAGELLEIGFGIVDESGLGRRSPLVEQIRSVQRQLAAKSTLASLVEAPSTSASG